MDIRLVTALLWTLFWGLMVAGFAFERYLRYLMEPPVDAPRTAVRSHRKVIRGVAHTWQDDMPPSPWDELSWEEKMSWMMRRSVLNWITAFAGAGMIIAFVFYTRHELELLRRADAGDVPATAVLFLNRPEVILQMVVMVVSVAAIVWLRKRPL